MGWFKRSSPESMDASQIIPRIKNSKFLEALREMNVPADQFPVTEPFVGELLVTYSVDLPNAFVSVTPATLSELGVDAPSLRELSLDNLRARAPKVQILDHGGFYQVAIGDNHDACILIAPNFWRQFAESMPGDIIVGVPDRDTVLIARDSEPMSVELLASIVAEQFAAGGTHALTADLLRWTADQWEVFQSPGD